MPNRLPALSAFLLVGSFASIASLAQYIGPSNTPQYRAIADILKNPVDDAPVVLEGYVSKQLTGEKYLFTDGQSEIQVEIDSKVLPKTPIDEKTRVQIRGEVDKDYQQGPEIEVKSVTVLK
jgi:uncharacterized protein (TIGR00156 family)